MPVYNILMLHSFKIIYLFYGIALRDWNWELWSLCIL